MTANCKAQAVDRGSRMGRMHPCRRKATKDGYCAVHHPEAVEARRKKVDARWQAESDQWRAERRLAVLGTEAVGHLRDLLELVPEHIPMHRKIECLTLLNEYDRLKGKNHGGRMP